jgi:tetratricopeptide (TPR) repeat protein
MAGVLSPRAIVATLAVFIGTGQLLAANPEAKALHRANKLYKLGEAAMREGDLARATDRFDHALEIVAGFPQAHLGLGHVSMRTGDYQAALEHYESAKNGYEMLGLAVMGIEAKRYADARHQIVMMRDSIALLQGAGPGTAQSPLANLHISKLQNAIHRLEVMEAPIETDAGKPPPEIHFYIGNAWFRLDGLQEAVAAWEACAAGNPRFAMVHNNLALAYWRQGKIDRALASLDQAERLGFAVNPQFRADLAAARATIQ